MPTALAHHTSNVEKLLKDDPLALAMYRKSQRASRYAMRRAEARAEVRAEQEKLAEEGIVTRAIWNCQGGEPVIQHPERVVVPIYSPDESVRMARLDERYVSTPVGIRGDLSRFMGGRVVVRPMRFLASDTQGNFGGLPLAQDRKEGLGMVSARLRRAKKARKSGHADDRAAPWEGQDEESDRMPYRGPTDEELKAKSDREWQEELARVQNKN